MFRNRLAKEKWDELNQAIDNSPTVVPCTNTDPEIWFGDQGVDDPYSSGYSGRTAKKLCKVCPVKEICLEYAIVNVEMHGTWGGLTPRERQRLRKN